MFFSSDDGANSPSKYTRFFRPLNYLLHFLCTDTRLKTRDKPKPPLPPPPVPNPLAHREPKVRFSIADDSSQPIQHSGGSAYSLPGDTRCLTTSRVTNLPAPADGGMPTAEECSMAAVLLWHCSGHTGSEMPVRDSIFFDIMRHIVALRFCSVHRWQ